MTHGHSSKRDLFPYEGLNLPEISFPLMKGILIGLRPEEGDAALEEFVRRLKAHRPELLMLMEGLLRSEGEKTGLGGNEKAKVYALNYCLRVLIALEWQLHASQEA